MLTLPLAGDDLLLIVVDAPREARTFGEDAAPKVNQDGEPLFDVTCSLINTVVGGAEIVKVRVPQLGLLPLGVPVRPVGLSAFVWQMDGRTGVSFRADRLEPAGGSLAKAG